MPIEYRRLITRRMLQAEPDALFVFGDNMIEKGLGGQAAEMRGEPNAVGIPTKRIPSVSEAAYFTDADFDRVVYRIDMAFGRLMGQLYRGGLVVWPQDGVGTGLAELPRRAPKIWGYIEGMRQRLEAINVKS